jgi:RNA polymerase sigma factor (sigma-70 family)
MSDAPGPVTERAGRAGHDSADDAAVVRRSVGEPGCFAVLFDRHAAAIYRYVARRLGPDAADDLCSETFLIAFQRRARYDRAQPDARPWLYGIATNLISRRRREEIRFFHALARMSFRAPGAPGADQVAEWVDAQAVSGQLAAALASLPGPCRDTLLLIASGLSHQEVAQALGVPIGTVASRLARARRRLRSALGGDNPAQGKGEMSDG